MVASVELFSRFPANPIVTVDDLPYRANSVFNPGAALVDGETILLMRVEDRRGPSPPPAPGRPPGEVWGLEAPRLTWLPEEGHWVIAYTAFSRRGPLVSLATTTAFRTFTRLGPGMPPGAQDAAPSPRRFDGRWLLVHRPTPLVGGAHIWTSASPDLRYWGDQHLLLEAREGGWWDARKIGLGPPPLETPDGWLIMYHGVRTTASGSLFQPHVAALKVALSFNVFMRNRYLIQGPEAPYER